MLYLKTTDGISSPIKIGTVLDSTRVNWNNGDEQSDYGGSTSGTDILSWLRTYYLADYATLSSAWNVAQTSQPSFGTTRAFDFIGGHKITFSSYGMWQGGGQHAYFLGFGITIDIHGTSVTPSKNASQLWFTAIIDITSQTQKEEILDSIETSCIYIATDNTTAHCGLVTKSSIDAFRTDVIWPFQTPLYPSNIWPLLFDSAHPSNGPDSDEDGGWGDFNDGTDNISLPGVPEISALSAGFVNMYNPTSSQLQVLVNALWSNDLSQIFWKMLTSPMESLVSLQIFPVAPTVTASPVNIVMGNVTLQDQSTTPITFALAPALTNQYKVFDCGSLNMNEYWGSALDYSPYSKAEIFLPYIGVKEIDINDVMAATLHLQYIVDFLTGTCTAQLQCVKAQHMDFSAPLYHWQGNMAMAIPATASDMSQLITSIASTLVSAGLTVATGGSGAVLAAGVAGGALNMANAHPRIEKGGTIAMTAGALDNQTPFIILTRPIQSKPANFHGFKGWPSNITAEIGSLTGYTEIEYIHVEIDSATDEEKSEIERLLKEGVII